MVQATVNKIENYDHTVLTIINYDCTTLIVQATGNTALKTGKTLKTYLDAQVRHSRCKR
jgi:hypothetical protein